MAATTTSETGRDLRSARAEAGLTRAQLAGLTGCSLAALGNIEQGAVPKRSRVLDRALAVIDAVLDDGSTTSEATVDGRGSAKTAVRGAGRDAG
jgi:transcriptional regulator with XRE-family HTH domain